MIWTMYRVVFRLLAPLHVGYFKQGNLQRVRSYVTGRVLWGALTARLARDFGREYAEVGDQVNEQLAFSYFYPSTDPSKVTLFPWQDEEKFAWLYLNAYASTALNYSHNVAEEGSLHETEYIAPWTREGDPVYLVGYLLEREGCDLRWRQALNRLQLGGERTYGWGRVACDDERSIQQTEKFFDGWDVDLNADRPRVIAQPGGQWHLVAHALAADPSNSRVHKAVSGISGLVEPLVGRETRSADGFGAYMSQAYICYAPGSLVTDDEFTCSIGPYGIWEAENIPNKEVSQ